MSNEVKRYVDTAMQEMVLIAFTVKKYGPGIAAAVGAIQAIYDILSNTPPKKIDNYSVEVAIGDLSKDIDKQLDKTSMKNHLSVVTASHDGGDTDDNTLKRATNDVDYWDDAHALASLEGSVDSFHNMLANGQITSTIDWLEARKFGEMVASLDLYLIARTNLHRQLHKKLQIQSVVLQRQALENGNTIALPEFYDTHHPLIDDFCDSLQAAIDHADKPVAHLEKVFSNRLADARAFSVKQNAKPGLARRQSFDTELRRINSDAYVQYTSEDRVKNHRLILDAFHKTLEGLESYRTKVIVKKKKPYNPLGH